ncbi:MAG: NADH:flavin oxidoreductase [Deltaproteobacteria bacterium]|jgi:2,4-dienoyl-CoA reductase-like NADH-dependent reductase (Old Yellow Enzyme family)|nr:NADH:flavin oxidoreductase [Deltaproteobacteria bacterium]
MAKSLFDETLLGGASLPNRFFRAAVGDRVPAGGMGAENYKLYDDLAKGGVGAIITGFTKVAESEEEFLPIFSLASDSQIPAHRKLTDLAHQKGAAIFSQLVYIGSHHGKPFPEDNPQNPRALPFLSPSGPAPGVAGPWPRAITLAEISRVATEYGRAAQRAQKAGYDGVEIHAAHGFLLSQFLSPLHNKRSDSYGGDGAGRARIVRETYAAVRAAVGENFPTLLKIDVRDGAVGGVDFKETLALCRQLAEDKLDAVEVSGDWWEREKNERAYYLQEAAALASQTKAKVILTGGLREKDMMFRILNETDIAYFGMARPFMENPDLINAFARGL